MLTMGQFVNVLFAIDKAHTVPQRALDCKPDLGGLNQVNGSNHSTPSAQSVCGKYSNIFTRCVNRNQFGILMAAVANVRKWQTDMSYKCEHQTLTKKTKYNYIRVQPYQNPLLPCSWPVAEVIMVSVIM